MAGHSSRKALRRSGKSCNPVGFAPVVPFKAAVVVPRIVLVEPQPLVHSGGFPDVTILRCEIADSRPQMGLVGPSTQLALSLNHEISVRGRRLAPPFVGNQPNFNSY